MRWIQTTNGEQAHAVIKNSTKTICGIRLRHVKAILLASDGGSNRCGNCDREWRKRGLAGRQPPPPKMKDAYTPRFTYRDWEEM